MDLGEIEWDDSGWIDLVVEGSCDHGNEPSGPIEFLEILE
jgi:hypothetical protein